MRNGCMECFRIEAYCKICRSDKNTESSVYRENNCKSYISPAKKTGRRYGRCVRVDTIVYACVRIRSGMAYVVM